MSCKTFNLKSCEIRGATYQGRKIDFVNKVITQDTFTAKVYDEQGYLLTEIIGLKSGSIVYFPFTAIQNLSKDKYRIKYWADFYLLGTILLGEEELIIGNTCPNCEVDDSTLPFVLELGTETINFSLQLIYIAIGEGSGGEVDLTAYLKKEDAILQYAQRNHTHSYNDLSDLPTITAGIQSIQEGSNITIDNTDPDNPIISSQAGFNGIATSDSTTVSFTGDGTISNPLSADSNSISVTKTSELNNDGADGVNPFITANDVPNPDLSGYATTTDLDAEILNRELADTNLQSQITTEKNRNDTQDGLITANTNAIALKFDKPTVVSDFSSYSNIVAVDDFGNSAKVPSGTIDVMSMFFDWSVKWFFPNPFTTTYNTFRTGAITQQGAATVNDGIAPCVNYNSATSTLGFFRGSPLIIRTDYNFIHTRKFTIRTTVANQRVLVGISNLFGTIASGNVAMSTLTNTIGICMDSGSSNLFYIWNDATGAANLQDTGWANNINYAYELTITGTTTSIRIKLMRVHKTTLVKESQFIDITEFQNALHYPIIWCVDSASTSVVTVGDYGGLLMIKGFTA